MDRDEVRDEIDRSLSRLAAATEGLAPGPRLSDAVIDAARRVEPAADPLAGIARATDGLAPGDALADSVIGAARRAEDAGLSGSRARPRADARGRAGATSWLDGVVRSGPAAVGLAALAAAASFLLFLASERDVDAALASSVDTVEVSE